MVAAEDLRPGVIGEDNRVTVQTDQSPWDAIGHVNIAGYRTVSKCSGVLIRPNVVLTAAHCLLDPRTRREVSADRVHFLLGVNGGEWKAHSMAKCLLFPQTDQRRTPITPDIAAIVLTENLHSRPVQTTMVAEPQSGMALVHASYPADHRYRLSADLQCRLVRAFPTIWFTNCDTHPASSGGPVFTNSNGRLQLAGIIVGTTDHRYTIAVPSTAWTALIQNIECH